MTNDSEPRRRQQASPGGTPRKRPYRSPLRERQAELTRNTIVEAALTMFSARGFAATSMAEIARAAGVSLQTLYDAIGTKRDLVIAVIDLMDAAVDFGSLAGEVEEETDPHRVIALPMARQRQFHEQFYQFLAVVQEAAGTDEDVAAAIAEGHRRHIYGTRIFVGRLEYLGALDDSLSSEDAVRTAALLTLDASWRSLVFDFSMSWDEVESYMVRALESLLLPL